MMFSNACLGVFTVLGGRGEGDYLGFILLSIFRLIVFYGLNKKQLYDVHEQLMILFIILLEVQGYVYVYSNTV